MRFVKAPAVVCSLVWSALAHAGVINVPADQPSVQQAVAAAVDGDEIIIAPGVYFEQVDLLGKAITLRSTDPDDPAVVAATVIDGGNDPDLAGFPQNPGSTITASSGETQDTRLVGLTITGGAALQSGGGVNVTPGATITLDRCVITRNWADGSGGGLHARFGPSPVITSCSFIDNRSENDGGGALIGIDGAMEMSDCVFRDNTAVQGGGGLATSSNTNDVFRLVRTSFVGNVSGASGGGASILATSAVLVDCDFVGNVADRSGGGAYSTRRPVEIVDCTFRDNEASYSGGGAAAFNNDDGNTIPGAVVTITGSLFEENRLTGDSSDGAGLSVFAADAHIFETRFVMNTSATGGGGAFLGGSDDAHVVDSCFFELNSAVESGGGIVASFSEVTVVDSTFIGNQTADRGGAVAMFSVFDPKITSCTFENNDAEDGGGVYMSGANPVPFADFAFHLSDSTFTGNTATRGGGYFGASNPSGLVSGCDFVGNAAAEGGGVYRISNAARPIRFVACLFRENRAVQTGGAVHETLANGIYANSLFDANQAVNGGAFFFECSEGQMINCTYSGNTASSLGGVIRTICTFTVEDPAVVRNAIMWNNDATLGTAASVGINTALDVAYSNVEGGLSALVQNGGTLIFGDGNIDVDPVFVDPDGPDDDPSTTADNDYRIGAGSGVIDAGANPPTESLGVTTDLGGAARFFDDADTPDTGVGPAPIVDMGAHEFQGVPCPVDFAEPFGTLDFFDVSAFLQLFNAGDPAADFNADGNFDFFDVSTFLQLFSSGC